MKLIVGLGNPGEKYKNTRHNVGFMVVDELLRRLVPVGKTEWEDAPNLKSKIYNLKSEVVLAKPQVFMNASGFAVRKLWGWVLSCESGMSCKGEEYNNLWVIHDDLDLPLGKIKIVQGRASAGHHGVESIIRELGSADFVRFRLGVGHPLKEDEWYVSQGGPVDKNVKHKEVEEYVLEEFSGKDRVEAGKMIKKTAEAVRVALEKGLEEAINQYNFR